ncbi:5-formyltetrahydrofolate cyclo-ligase [Segetibacter sp. 3557_3]|uniref:5-formyltetrahydrofolate cyclo-ligase n=1 Tax=Segetibacter sp. 3557_3 TaxID=2547429 RepID=UPI001058860E|nr:5-formyltetrahydrofolate cyclo-ligase [Segetibacter sp. 3557_3]TDH29176.1 5-formyltetrahydrofolate cyclo-ligase [Segetibacter sp. 3557_3]
MTKKEVRNLYKAKRFSLSSPERMKMDDLMLIWFQRLAFDTVTTVLSYWPIEERGEMNTHLFVRYLEYLIPGLRVCYPVINPDTAEMTAFEVNDDTTFKLNEYNIAEPENAVAVDPHDIDMVFVPLLAFDAEGYRVGYGKGFYDRFLMRCSPEVNKVGFSYFEAIDKIDDRNQFDVPLNYCITPQRLYEF